MHNICSRQTGFGVGFYWTAPSKYCSSLFWIQIKHGNRVHWLPLKRMRHTCGVYATRQLQTPFLSFFFPFTIAWTVYRARVRGCSAELNLYRLNIFEHLFLPTLQIFPVFSGTGGFRKNKNGKCYYTPPSHHAKNQGAQAWGKKMPWNSHHPHRQQHMCFRRHPARPLAAFRFSFFDFIVFLHNLLYEIYFHGNYCAAAAAVAAASCYHFCSIDEFELRVLHPPPSLSLTYTRSPFIPFPSKSFIAINYLALQIFEFYLLPVGFPGVICTLVASHLAHTPTHTDAFTTTRSCSSRRILISTRIYFRFVYTVDCVKCICEASAASGTHKWLSDKKQFLF